MIDESDVLLGSPKPPSKDEDANVIKTSTLMKSTDESKKLTYSLPKNVSKNTYSKVLQKN